MENSINNNNFISSKDGNDEDGIMHSKIDNIEIRIDDEAYDIEKNFLNHSKVDIAIISKNQWKVGRDFVFD